MNYWFRWDFKPDPVPNEVIKPSELILELINSEGWLVISLLSHKLKIQLHCEVWEAIFHQI